MVPASHALLMTRRDALCTQLESVRDLVPDTLAVLENLSIAVDGTRSFKPMPIAAELLDEPLLKAKDILEGLEASTQGWQQTIDQTCKVLRDAPSDRLAALLDNRLMRMHGHLLRHKTMLSGMVDKLETMLLNRDSYAMPTSDISPMQAHAQKHFMNQVAEAYPTLVVLQEQQDIAYNALGALMPAKVLSPV